jgi:hypothetical protein
MRSTFTASLLCLSLILGCAGNGAGSSSNGSQTRARIDNDTSLDMDIYVVRESGATRLGFVPANQTATFNLTRGVLAGAVSVRFEARPVRRSGRPVGSELFPVNPGDEVTWHIPAQ